MFNEKAKRARFEHLDKRRQELKAELDQVVNEMIEIWQDYAKLLQTL